MSTADQTSRRIHIVGASPRTGTTLMFELMRHCFDVQSNGQHEQYLFDVPVGVPGVFVSKQPHQIVEVARVIRWDPRLYCIFMQRDPRSVATSRHGADPTRYYCDANIWLRNFHWRCKLPGHPRIVDVRYENLVADPDAVQAYIEERLPFLRKTAPFSKYHEIAAPVERAKVALGGVRAIAPDRLDRWRDDLPRVKQQIDTYPELPQRLVDAGYERDRAWVADLADIDYADGDFATVRPTREPRMGPIQRFTYRCRRRARAFRGEAAYVLRTKNVFRRSFE